MFTLDIQSAAVASPTLGDWLRFAIFAVSAILIALIVTAIIALAARPLLHRGHLTDFVPRLRRPFRVLLLVVLLWIAVAASFPYAPAREGVDQVMKIATILSGAWFFGSALLFLEDQGIRRYDTAKIDNRRARRARTQALILRRLTVAVIVLIAVGAVLLTFPAVRAVGTSVLASAGLASVIAGLAAQSTLANLFAGLQLAFSDAIRVDDVVVVDQQWGRIEEVTLSYVVVHLYDDRRLVLPSTFFTAQPFENWTRSSSQLLGAVEFDLDWRMPPAQMRDQLAAILQHATSWDGRTQVLQLTDAQGGYVHVRILVSAKDAPSLWDVRCFVREEMVRWLQEKHPYALPRQRVEVEEPVTVQRDSRKHDAGRSGLFSGSADGEARARQFTEAIPLPVDEDAVGTLDEDRMPPAR